MKPRERVLATLKHKTTDQIPRFEIWIDALVNELGQKNISDTYVNMGQDCIMMPTTAPAISNAWKNGVDEWGRVWTNGSYVDGRVNNIKDLDFYTPALSYVEEFFDHEQIKSVQTKYPDHCHIYGTHIGPFTAGFMAMGFENFLFRLLDDSTFAHKLLELRTEWCITMYKKAVEMGADVLILGDDGGQGNGPMISPEMWREFIFPYHQRIIEALDKPVIWHSDGNIESLLPMAIEAGFSGIHGLDPMAGMDLSKIKQEYGKDLVLVGNLDICVLFGNDLISVRNEVKRCMKEGDKGEGFMFASCNSICKGMNPAAVLEMFQYAGEISHY